MIRTRSVRSVIVNSRYFLLPARFFYSYTNRQVVPCFKKLTQNFFTPVVPPLLAISVFGWKSEPEMEAAKSELSETEAVNHADELYRSKEDGKGNEAEAVKNLHAFLLQYKESSNPELLWRLARASWDLANLSVTDKETKKSLIYEAHEFAKQALASGEEIYACHSWFAITLSDVGDYEGSKEKISNAYKIQNHFKKAIELNPNDATCYHLLGRWCFTVADIPWYQRKIASAIFSTPPSSTYEEAIEQFERAEQLKPNFYSMNQLWVAKSYLRLGKKAEARQWLEKLLTFDAKTEEDLSALNEAKEHLKSC